jgi:hypothetical protein
MKFLNDFKNVFAIVGVVSLIFWTCASESNSDDSSSNLPPQLTGGTYQISQATPDYMSIINTETGVVKSYYRDVDTGGEWVIGWYENFPNASGSVTATH